MLYRNVVALSIIADAAGYSLNAVNVQTPSPLMNAYRLMWTKWL